MQPSTVNGTDLGAQEWLDALFLRYGLDPPDLPKYYNGCNAKFTICHTLECRRGGLVKARHNMLQDGVADLTCKAFTLSHVRNNPLIIVDCAVNRQKSNLDGTIDLTNQDGASPPEATEQKGDLLICDLY